MHIQRHAGFWDFALKQPSSAALNSNAVARDCCVESRQGCSLCVSAMNPLLQPCNRAFVLPFGQDSKLEEVNKAMREVTRSMAVASEIST